MRYKGDYAELCSVTSHNYSRYPNIFLINMFFDKIVFSSSDYNDLAFYNNLKNIFFSFFCCLLLKDLSTYYK